MEKNNYDNSHITKNHVLHELACIAFANATDYINFKTDTIKSELTHDEASAVSEIIQSKDGIRVKFYDKMKALDMISKQMGFYDNTDDDDGEEKGVVILSETQNEE